MRFLKKSVVAAVLAGCLVFGATAVAPSAGADSLLGCPQLCLTEGLVASLGLTSSSVSTEGISVQSESRTYNYTWIALDLTTPIPTPRVLFISIFVEGTTDANGIFTGSGSAILSNPATGANHYTDVSLTDAIAVVTATSSELTLTATGVVGVGAASYITTSAHDWDYCGDC